MSTMKFDCCVVGDLLPLYLQGECSAETETGIRDHLAGCEACEKLARSMSCLDIPPEEDAHPGESPQERALLQYSKKVRMEKARRRLLSLTLVFFSLLVGGLLFLTLQRMAWNRAPTVYSCPDEIWNLTAGALEVTGEEAGDYLLSTNFEQIKVEAAAADGTFPERVTVCLSVDPVESASLEGVLESEEENVTFTNLTSASYYRVTVQASEEVLLTISEGRPTDFFSCLLEVLGDLAA